MRIVYRTTSPGSSRRGLSSPSRYRARTSPIDTSRANPSGATSISRTNQSVSGADEAACKLDDRIAGHLQPLLERFALVNENVLPVGQRPLVGGVREQSGSHAA